MQLKQIKPDRKRLADEVYDQLLAAIRAGEIGVSERLVQERLAGELNISRTPIREALMRLEQDGILVTSPRGGFVIHKMTDQEVRELFQARAAIEGQAVRILASQNDLQKNLRARQVIEQEEGAATGSLQDYFEANRKIHRAFVELTENRYLVEMFDNVWNRALSFQLFAAIDQVDRARSRTDHLALVDAIETGDPATAMEKIIDHITLSFELQVAALDKNGGQA